MENKFDRQVSGSADDVVGRLVQALEQQGLEVASQRTTGDHERVRVLTVTDPEATRAAMDANPDAATVASVSINVRQADEGVRITFLDPVAKATLTDEAELLEPAERLHAHIAAALDELTGGRQEDPRIGDPAVRRSPLDAIGQAATSLGDLDTQARADTLFVLAKAYTAIVSLERTEEIELHLA